MTHPQIARRRRRLLRLWLAGVLIILVIAALVLPPLINLSRYQRQIAASLAASLGHSVEVSGITLTLLPRPGVQIANLVVDSAAGYSAEPILQCSSVTAVFRLTSLWRGRLEIARISLDEPSLNLERAPDGQWNFASVLLQASHTPQAPTGRTLPHGQHRFPYIEVSNGRINFKHGAEKLPFSFMNADVSVWLENPDEWQVRFAAQPMRTDINPSIADSGLVRINGSVHRASSANELPLGLDAEWNGAPLGQATRILLARDLGWRGNTHVTAHITGVPDALALQVTADAANFHRELVEPARPLDLHATCTATYRHWQGIIDGIHCLSPDGSLRLSGDISQIHAAEPHYSLKLAVVRLPANTLLEFLRHIRGRLNPDVRVEGAIDGEITCGYAAQQTLPVAGGSLLASHLLVHAGETDQPLPDLRFSAAASHPFALLLEPARIGLGAAKPLLASGMFTRQGYLIRYGGAALLSRLLPLASAFRVMPAGLEGVQGSGTADLNLAIQGDWLADAMDSGQPVPLSTVNGSLSLHNTIFQPSYLLTPVHIATATAALSPGELRWNGVSAAIGATRFGGSFSIPLPCASACLRHFDLAADTVNVSTLMASLNGQDEGVVEDLLNRVRSRSRNWPPMSGALHVARLQLGKADIESVAAVLALHDDQLRVESFDGLALGGTLHATGTIELGSAPSYKAEGELHRISIPALAALFNEHWGPGLLDLSGELALRGGNAASLAGSAAGALHWDWTGGGLPQPTASPLRRFDRWTANGRVANGQIALTTSEITSGSATASLTGTIGSDRTLNLQIGPSAATGEESTAPVTLTGTLGSPTAEQE